ncbi:MAG: LacI family DNA-binding transcriptional regulator [Hydrogenophaga sp.]|nr:LacI family DNA-binding transcriptional regulator [Hydrogenophaga sp.]
MPRKPAVPAKLAEASSSPAATVSPKGRQRLQMADIARLAGVSASTVSRALSGSPLIPEATSQRIRDLARQLNYKVNVGAANLRRRDVNTVGVMVLGDPMKAMSDPFLLSILGAVADALDSKGMNLLLSRIKTDDPEHLSTLVDSGQVGGLIVIGQLTWHDRLNHLAATGLPLVVWGACLPDAIYPVVGGDNLQGGYEATNHLIRQGCRRIAFFGDTQHPEVRLRHQGYARALAEAGLELDPRLHQAFLFGDTRIREVIDKWLDQGESFDAVFAASDVTAISIIGALGERGVAVPSQVKVVGYDDIAISAHLHPSLSSVRQPTQTAGAALVELLLERMAGQPSRANMLPTELIRRESSA